MIFSIIFGSKSRNRVMGQIQYVCPMCHQNSFHTVVRSQRFFTLYFIPTFPMGKTTISRCNTCGYQEGIDNKRADAMMLQAPKRA